MPSPSPGSPAPMFHRGLTSQKHGHRMRPSSAFGVAEEQTLVDSQGGSCDIEIISLMIIRSLKLSVILISEMITVAIEIICSAITPVQCNWNYLWYHCDIVISLKIIWDYLSHGWHCPLKLPVSTHCVTLWHCVTLKVFVSARCVYTLCLHIGKYPSNAVQNLRRAKIICASAIENICNNLWLWDRSKSPKIFVTLLTLFTGNNLWQALWGTFPCDLVSL